ncbi:hypothetical protein [Frondihabitans sp. VKM Ac-2883]|uniref:hypothetical protein n=1 Tax=Frondihabitans sp. VKM Ac-2883 TaxID=2783823 RepID=UPI00188C1E46|nr:hypothetical protein [Frondihabitans sp. VKM Ac-2883]MBF4577085.1 hypothetical protein [Frondihabitans sp. VKM Ac-2883]
MKKVSGAVSHPLVVEEPLVLTGTALRGALVCDGGSLDLRGAVADKLTIEPGGYVLLSGTCTGSIVVHPGALLEISGTVTGEITRNDGEVWAMAGATIGGRMVGSGGFFVAAVPEAAPVLDPPRFRIAGQGPLVDVVA